MPLVQRGQQPNSGGPNSKYSFLRQSFWDRNEIHFASFAHVEHNAKLRQPIQAMYNWNANISVCRRQ